MIRIYDEIVTPAERAMWDGGIDADTFAQQLAAETGPEIEVRINSPGGDMDNGLAIYNSLLAARAAGKRVVCCVDGAAHSAASFVAMAGDRTVMARSSSMLVHNPWAFAVGNADDLRARAAQLDTGTAKMVPVYAQKTGLSEETIKALLTAETELLPDQAVALKFADEVVEPPGRNPDPDEVKAWAADRVRHPFARAALQAAAKKMPSRPAAASPQPQPQERSMDTAALKAKAKDDPALAALLAEHEKLQAEAAKAKADADQVRYEDLVRAAKADKSALKADGSPENPHARKIQGPAHEARIRAAYKTTAELETFLATAEPAKALAPEQPARQPGTESSAAPLSPHANRFIKTLNGAGVPCDEKAFAAARDKVRMPRLPEVN